MLHFMGLQRVGQDLVTEQQQKLEKKKPSEISDNKNIVIKMRNALDEINKLNRNDKILGELDE